MEKSDKQSKKSAILISLMFLGLISPKAWGYAEKELPPSFSEDTFSSNDNPSLLRAVLNGSDLSETKFINETFSFSRAVLIDEKGVAICQVNLVENPQFLPEFAEPGSSETLQPLDLPECEEQSLGIVAQYAEQAWVQREVALAPAAVALGAYAGGCLIGSIISFHGTNSEGFFDKFNASWFSFWLGGFYGVFASFLGGLPPTVGRLLGSTGLGMTGGLACSLIAGHILYE